MLHSKVPGDTFNRPVSLQYKLILINIEHVRNSKMIIRNYSDRTNISKLHSCFGVHSGSCIPAAHLHGVRFRWFSGVSVTGFKGLSGTVDPETASVKN